MDMTTIKARGLVLLGCGKMGSAMLKGWLDGGLPAASVWVIDPDPSDWLQGIKGLNLNAELPASPAVVLVAVKPQMMGDALPSLQAMGGGETLFISVAAGITLGSYADILGADTPVVRAMPNTPAAVGRGITGIIGNDLVSNDNLSLAEALLCAVGQVVRLDGEEQMSALTAISGCGPAYVFHLIEVMAQAGEAAGLSADLALNLARATVAGAGHLAENAEENPSQLRVNVTSPNGVTQAALEVLMDPETGFPKVMDTAVKAAIKRDKELGA